MLVNEWIEISVGLIAVNIDAIIIRIRSPVARNDFARYTTARIIAAVIGQPVHRLYILRTDPDGKLVLPGTSPTQTEVMERRGIRSLRMIDVFHAFFHQNRK